MMTARSQTIRQMAVPCSVVWARNIRPIPLFPREGFTAQRSCGPAWRVTIAAGDGRTWHGSLQLIDEDEVDHVCNYDLAAQSNGDRMTASITVRATADSSTVTTVAVNCVMTSTTDAAPLSDDLTSHWIAAIEAVAVSGPDESRAGPIAARSTDVACASPPHRPDAPWALPAIALGAGLGVGALLRQLPRWLKRIR